MNRELIAKAMTRSFVLMSYLLLGAFIRWRSAPFAMLILPAISSLVELRAGIWNLTELLRAQFP